MSPLDIKQQSIGLIHDDICNAEMFYQLCELKHFRKLNQQLDILHKKITTNPTYLNAQQQLEEKQHKERKQQKKTQKTTDKHKHVKDQRENEEDRKESREGQKESRDAQNEASGQILPFQFDTNLKIVSEAVECVVDLQDYKM